ncbi:hypothetical protein X777_13875 [Ooceraea biroi]|uniref:SWIM-type domain-containing protein n=1 Tax=Ooceraea biroi TaxID=2015173 RepID=A0A026VXG2_OOCBI|nr:hypothetical protein X777_13875 [Ooceraea biroi]
MHKHRNLLLVVEVDNGRLKQCYRYFNKVVPNVSLHKMSIDFNICMALLNFTISISERMLTLVDKENCLTDLVNNERLTRYINDHSTKFASIDDTGDIDFPVFDDRELKQLFCGSFHFEIAKSYVAEHFKATGRYKFFAGRVNANFNFDRYHHGSISSSFSLIACQSRHKFSNTANIFSQTYCTCLNDCRTVGMCAHSASFVWYLSFGRHLPQLHAPATALDNYFAQVRFQRSRSMMRSRMMRS